MSPAKQAQPGTVLVTGATGFLGKHLIESLRDPEGPEGPDAARRTIRALVRTPTLHLERHGVDVTVGDVCRMDDCRAAMRGVSEVYHLAGRVARGGDADAAAALYRLHVEGTRALLQTAAEAKVRRVVLVSTSGTIAVSPEPEISNEGSPYRTETVRHWPYYLSKIYQEQVATRLGEELKLDVVRVNPSLLLGPGDDRSSSTGDVSNVVRGRLPLIPKGGGVAFVDARDVANGCVRAMRSGRSGERYLFSAENVTLEKFLGRVARVAGVASPRPWLETRYMRSASRLMSGVFRSLGASSPLDTESLEMAEHYWYCTADKAKRELGFNTRDPQLTVLDTVRDIQRRHNLLPKPATVSRMETT
ncbi:MAG: NAD-dependent epimerase/dehydratase family protein [Myxococcota bacterium]